MNYGGIAMAKYRIKKKLAKRCNYGAKRLISVIIKIVLHFTANDGATDEANGNYFANNNVGASAHVFIDDDSITQSVPDNYVAYSVGGRKYPGTKGGKLYRKATNANTYNIEMCDVLKNGKHDVSEKTLENTIDFVRVKMKEFNLTVDDVIRHYDVNGKPCPAYFVDEKKWAEFKKRLSETEKEPQVKAKIVLARDGWFGRNTIRRTQQYFGIEQNGHVYRQPKGNAKYLTRINKSVWQFKDNYDDGSLVVKKMQKLFGVKQDGLFGKNTIKAMQKFLKVKQTGYLNKDTVIAWQKWLNKQAKTK